MTRQEYEDLRRSIIASFRKKVIKSWEAAAKLRQAEEAYKKERRKAR